MGREYLVDGKLTGRDMAVSGAPQRFGHDSLMAMIRARRAESPVAVG